MKFNKKKDDENLNKLEMKENNEKLYTSHKVTIEKKDKGINFNPFFFFEVINLCKIS